MQGTDSESEGRGGAGDESTGSDAGDDEEDHLRLLFGALHQSWAGIYFSHINRSSTLLPGRHWGHIARGSYGRRQARS
jgi:hypothetical protein